LSWLTLALILTPASGLAAKRTVTRAPSPKKSIAASFPAARAVSAVGSRMASATINPRVLRLALESATCAMAKGAVERTAETLTLIDYSRPSTVPRLWVLDLQSGELLFEELVAHGSGSGDDLATRFSNTVDSRQSSLGLFTTEETYVGKHGYSLRLNGLESGVNDRARERALVIHGAAYVSQMAVASLGRLGRSWGCPALRPAVTRRVIDRIKGGSVVFAYYPDPSWLARSTFLNACRTPDRS